VSAISASLQLLHFLFLFFSIRSSLSAFLIQRKKYQTL